MQAKKREREAQRRGAEREGGGREMYVVNVKPSYPLGNKKMNHHGNMMVAFVFWCKRDTSHQLRKLGGGRERKKERKKPTDRETDTHAMKIKIYAKKKRTKMETITSLGALKHY